MPKNKTIKNKEFKPHFTNDVIPIVVQEIEIPWINAPKINTGISIEV